MADTVNVPLLGPTNKTTVLATVVGAGGVSAYLLYRNAKKKANAAAAAANATKQKTANAYGTTGYGSGYGYGSSVQYGYGNSMYGEYAPYPTVEAYGYGAYGYGYYNPYNGQYYGPGGGNEPSSGAPTTNAQWEQDAIQILQGEGYNPISVQQALGIYLAGGPYNNWTSQDQTILNAAIGVEGEPPNPPTTEPPGTQGNGSGGGGGNPPSTVSVPDVMGKRQQDAVQIIHSAGLESHTGSGFIENKLNYVGSQTPKAGTRVPSGSTVDIGGFTH
jgi:hypothetical protein